MSDVTHILDRAQQGDPNAAEELLPLVYEELRRLAAHKMAGELPGHTLQPTALVHEAYLRLIGQIPTCEIFSTDSIARPRKRTAIAPIGSARNRNPMVELSTLRVQTIGRHSFSKVSCSQTENFLMGFTRPIRMTI